MRRVIMCAMVGAVVATGACSASTPAPTVTPTATLTPASVAPTHWTEDGLPPVMYLWRDRYGGTFHKLPGYWSDGQGGEHVECWIITGDTALVMCPDGYTSSS